MYDIAKGTFSEYALPEPVTFQVPFTAHRFAARRVLLGIQQDPNPPAR